MLSEWLKAGAESTGTKKVPHSSGELTAREGSARSGAVGVGLRAIKDAYAEVYPTGERGVGLGPGTGLMSAAVRDGDVDPGPSPRREKSLQTSDRLSVF